MIPMNKKINKIIVLQRKNPKEMNNDSNYGFESNYYINVLRDYRGNVDMHIIDLNILEPIDYFGLEGDDCNEQEHHKHYEIIENIYKEKFNCSPWDCSSYFRLIDEIPKFVRDDCLRFFLEVYGMEVNVISLDKKSHPTTMIDFVYEANREKSDKMRIYLMEFVDYYKYAPLYIFDIPNDDNFTEYDFMVKIYSQINQCMPFEQTGYTSAYKVEGNYPEISEDVREIPDFHIPKKLMERCDNTEGELVLLLVENEKVIINQLLLTD